MNKPPVVLDTNLLISRVLTPSSRTADIVSKIIDKCQILVLMATIDEVIRVLNRSVNGKADYSQPKSFVQVLTVDPPSIPP